MIAALLIAAAWLSSAQARPLSDAELTTFYGYKYMAGPTRALPAPLNAAQSLKDAAAAAGIYVGAAINYGGMSEGKQGAQYPAVALSQFNLFTAENECKVGPVHPQPQQYDFAQCDFLAAAAVANASAFRMHNYCWDNENPAWLNALKDPGALSAALKAHIGNMSSHYLGNPATAYYAVDVVNEAVSDSGSSILKPTTPWYPALPDYVEIAFSAASAFMSSPNPLLCYNDYAAEAASSQKAGKVIALLKQLLAAGIPVNCVGLQMHVSVDGHPDAADVSANIKQLGALGMTVHITEMDVKCANCNGNAARLAAQAQVYADMLGACLANTNCKSFETWGVYDGDTWVGTENAPLLFDTNWQPKPAYDAVLATLQAHAASRSA